MAEDHSLEAWESEEYIYLKYEWDLVESLLGGTRIMRARSETYLYKHDRENPEAYVSRLQRSYLYSGLESGANSLASRPLKNGITLETESEYLKEFKMDVTQTGASLEAHCFTLFREALLKGFGYTLIDVPRHENKNALEDMQNPVEPYFIFLKAEQVLVFEKEAGLVHVMYERVHTDPTDGQTRFKELRVYTPNRVDIFDNLEDEKSKDVTSATPKTFCSSSQYGMTGSNFYGYGTTLGLGTTIADANHGSFQWRETVEHTLPFAIPIFRYETDPCFPPLMGLAYLNLTHWNSTSDQLNSTRVARFPILAGAGLERGKEAVIAPNRFVNLGKNGELKYVEHSGRALQAGLDELTRLEEQMGMFGAEHLLSQAGVSTATEKNINASSSTSKLSVYAKIFEAHIETLLQAVLDIKKMNDVFKVSILTEFDILDGKREKLESLTMLRQLGDISRTALLNMMKRYDVIPDKFDIEKDKELLELEYQDNMDMGMDMSPKVATPAEKLPMFDVESDTEDTDSDDMEDDDDT